MGDDPLPAPGVQHDERTGAGPDLLKELLLSRHARLVIGLVILKEAGVLEGPAPDDVAALGVDHGELFVLIFFLGKDPLFGQVGGRDDPQQVCRPLLPGFPVPRRDPVAEGQGLFPVDGVRIGPGDVDRRTDVRDPASVSQQFDPLVGNAVIVLRVRPGPGGIPLQGFRVDQVAGDGGLGMGRPDVCRGFLQGHVAAVDIMGPVVADGLLAFQVVFRHPLHGNRRVDEMLHLVLIVLILLMVGIERDKHQYGRHQGHIRHNDP